MFVWSAHILLILFHEYGKTQTSFLALFGHETVKTNKLATIKICFDL